VSDTGLTPLMMAVAGGHCEAAKYLLSKGEKINAKQYDGWTVLMHAAAKGDSDTIKFLLEKGAETKPKNTDGKTAAEIARENKHEEMAKLIENSNPP
jgi:ankyrin repeat protein